MPEANPYAPPSFANAPGGMFGAQRPNEPPLASHPITLPGRPPVQATVLFYDDRLLVERSDGGPTLGLTHADFTNGNVRFFIGLLTGAVFVVRAPPRTVVKLTPDVLASFRRWIEPHVDAIRVAQIRERSRVGAWLGVLLLAISVPPLAPTVVWTGAISGFGLAAVGLAGRFMKRCAFFLVVAGAWLVLAANNVLRTMERDSPGWLALSVLWVVLSIGAVKAYRFFAPAT